MKKRLFALTLILSACSGAPPPAYDFAVVGQGLSGNLTLRLAPHLETDRIVVRDASGALSTLPQAEWSSPLPELLQHSLRPTRATLFVLDAFEIDTVTRRAVLRGTLTRKGVTKDNSQNVDLFEPIAAITATEALPAFQRLIERLGDSLN
jgi:ABC-type transport auxiliary lipoprotein component